MRFIIVAMFLFLMACSESSERVESKLYPYLQEDLKFMVAEVLKSGKPETLKKEPFFVIRDLRFFEKVTEENYGAYAEVDFFIYKDIPMYQKRKYRYNAHYRQWDRYLKVLKFGSFKE